MPIKLFNLVLVLIFLNLCTSCGIKLFGYNYAVDLVNYGQNGLIILEMGSHKPYVRTLYTTTSAAGNKTQHDPRTPGIKDLEFVSRIYPSLPSKYRNPADAFGRFPGHARYLPDQVIVKWQLAKLEDCSDYHGVLTDEKRSWLSSKGYKPDFHRQAYDCRWVPIPDKVFSQTLDLDALVKQTEAYKKTGTSNPKGALSFYTLHLTFEFAEEKLRLDVDNSTTNLWR